MKTATFSQIFRLVYNLRMHDISGRIANVLVAVEAILAGSDKRDVLYPTEGSLLSVGPFCIDTPGFKQSLQWIFLPRMKQIL